MKKKIIFMGTPKFSVPILKTLLQDDDFEISLVVTQPDKRNGRGKNNAFNPVKQFAIENNLKLLQTDKISKEENVEILKSLESDFIITAAFGQFLSNKVLNIPKITALNVHASLLPKHRGGAPVHRSIMNADEKTGVTMMHMSKKMDEGDIISQQEIKIQREDNVETLTNKLSELGSDMIIDDLNSLYEGTASRKEQNHELSTYSPNITSEDRLLNPYFEDAFSLERHTQGLNPTHTPFMFINSKKYNIISLKEVNLKTNLEPGIIVDISKKNIYISAKNGTVFEIKKIQPSGKKVLDAAQFINGYGSNFKIGEQIINNNQV